LSAPIRFLAAVVIGWAGVRAATLGALPGFTLSYAKPAAARDLPPIIATRFPPISAPQPVQLPDYPPAQLAAAYAPYGAYPAYAAYPTYPPYARYAAIAPRLSYSIPYEQQAAPGAIPARPAWHLPSLDSSNSWQMSSLAAFPSGQSRPAPAPVQIEAASAPRFDHVQLSSWALLRGPSNSAALASGGTLGGSQAGARLTYAFNRWLAASVRTTSSSGGYQGMEVAGGVRVVPFRSIPIAITAERRQAFGHGGGRSAFALFLEGGLYRRPLPLDFRLDGYFQGGIVGLSSRDYFADGAFAVTRPVWGRVSAGLGVWGGVQPGLYRVDAGPRVSIRVRDNIYAHVDWRQRLAGSATPASGPALTLAADF
jgi:hypothetical protein